MNSRLVHQYQQSRDLLLLTNDGWAGIRSADNTAP